MSDDLPIIDISPLVEPSSLPESVASVAAQLDAACRQRGFFYVTGHDIDPDRLAALRAASVEFFSRPETDKASISMARGGRAWRGWFPLGGELTSGVADGKEGIYFGAELDRSDPRVVAGIALHGPNLFPDEPAELAPLVSAWIEDLTALGQQICRGLAIALGLDADWFARELCADPTVLFRIFRYPPTQPPMALPASDSWGVGEHTDYGLLTILATDDVPGLEVRSPDGTWAAAPPIPGAFICNLGDMLDRMTSGRWRSTPHRVRNNSAGDRYSFPFFFDPSWDAQIGPLPLDGEVPPDDADTRWDGRSLHASGSGALSGTYGDYLLDKVGRVFPQLGEHHL